MYEQLAFSNGGSIRIISYNLAAISSQVCHQLLTLPPQEEQANPSSNNDEPSLTKHEKEEEFMRDSLFDDIQKWKGNLSEIPNFKNNYESTV